MKSEEDFSDHILVNVKNTHFQCIEAHGSPGIPDLDYCVRSFEVDGQPYGRAGQIELKYGSVRSPPTMRPMQKRWFERRLYYGGSPMVWMATPQGMIYIYTRHEIPFLLKGKPRFIEWVDGAADSVHVTNKRVWKILETWMIQPISDGRSIWDVERQDPDKLCPGCGCQKHGVHSDQCPLKYN